MQFWAEHSPSLTLGTLSSRESSALHLFFFFLHLLLMSPMPLQYGYLSGWRYTFHAVQALQIDKCACYLWGTRNAMPRAHSASHQCVLTHSPPKSQCTGNFSEH